MSDQIEDQVRVFTAVGEYPLCNSGRRIAVAIAVPRVLRLKFVSARRPIGRFRLLHNTGCANGTEST
ncbi:hypothetical protein OG203_38300 [Nocardia sp. NBC_01499]|uniref:hypothetical protein n=1 Tax=Nocardia sp. NBC_01499 TaxID=2903597 RepID=UPI00386BC8A1